MKLFESKGMKMAVLAALLATVAACNTMEGVGKDVEAGGDALSDTARETKEEM